MDQEKKAYRDIQRQCKEKDCKNPFTLTAGEQEFFDRNALDERGNKHLIDPNETDAELAEKGLKRMKMPTRCPECRKKKRNRAQSPFLELRGKEYPPRRKELN